MKTKLVIIAAALVALLLLGTAANEYHQNRVEDRARVAAAQKQAADAQSARSKEQDVLVVKYNGEVAQCLLGADAYAKLPAATKATAKAPVCGTAIAD